MQEKKKNHLKVLKEMLGKPPKEVAPTICQQFAQLNSAEVLHIYYFLKSSPALLQLHYSQSRSPTSKKLLAIAFYIQGIASFQPINSFLLFAILDSIFHDKSEANSRLSIFVINDWEGLNERP